MPDLNAGPTGHVEIGLHGPCVVLRPTDGAPLVQAGPGALAEALALGPPPLVLVDAEQAMLGDVEEWRAWIGEIAVRVAEVGGVLAFATARTPLRDLWTADLALPAELLTDTGAEALALLLARSTRRRG